MGEPSWLGDTAVLRRLRGAFLSRHLYRTYSGYVLSQFKLMRRGFDATGAFRPKHAMHLIRLLHSGIHALTDGEIEQLKTAAQAQGTYYTSPSGWSGVPHQPTRSRLFTSSPTASRPPNWRA